MTQHRLQVLLGSLLSTVGFGGLVVLALTACTPQPPKPLVDSRLITIELVDGFDNPRQIGEATMTPHLCSIEIKKDRYPDCITHEVMHCFSGDWHQGRESDEYCY